MGNCSSCEREWDFDISPCGHCHTCRQSFCWTCAHEHRHLRERFEMLFLPNPGWKVNLKASHSEPAESAPQEGEASETEHKDSAPQ